MGQLSRFSPLVFDARDIAPVGYAAFAFALGVTVGVLVRRTLPAMAIAPSGHVFVLPDVAACQTGTQQQCSAFLATQHLRRQISYQPASRFWAFQAYETAISSESSPWPWPHSASGGSAAGA
jgi:hypothetical protein